ncbi:MAG: VOC family protein [Aquamicrobium sp.]|uniref:VOC family protein n=1 Tax=Aquamicrobium sp. TaxID=1872579 RepID=UPI00349E5A07|nr:VOC family protein [Aquamicrobium sp.]
MKTDGKLDYLEMQAGDGALAGVKAFYAAAFGWRFTDYGPSYAAFDEGLNGGFDGAVARGAKPLPVLYAQDLERTLAAVTAAGGAIVKPIFSFPSGRRFHFTDPAGNELAVWSE